MMPEAKQQVVFIARTLWGGGVEKVLYELAHGLDRDIFAPNVVYLIEENNPIAYDPSIPTIYLQPFIDELLPPKVVQEQVVEQIQPEPSPQPLPPVKIKDRPLRKKLIGLLRSIYYIVPELYRAKLHLRQRLQPLDLKTHEIDIDVIPPQPEAWKPPVRPDTGIDIVYFATPRSIPNSYEITNGIAELWVPALALRKVLDSFSQDAVLIPMDEYLTTMLWIAQLPPFRKVLASQHYPYSQAQPIRYPDEQVRRVKEWVYLNACRAADLVTFDSEGSRLDLVNNYNASPQKTISMPNLINCDLILEKSLQPLDVNPNLLKGKTIFTQVARLSLEKIHYYWSMPVIY